MTPNATAPPLPPTGLAIILAAPFDAVEVDVDEPLAEEPDRDADDEAALDAEVSEAEVKDSDTELEAILQNDWARFSELLRSSWHPASTQDSRSVENELFEI